jgi:hypothetical protein
VGVKIAGCWSLVGEVVMKLGSLTVAVVSVFVLMGAVCADVPPPDASAPTTTQSVCPVVRGERVDGLIAELTLDGGRTTFSQGETISMTLSITNCGDEEVIRFYSSGQRYDFVVSDTEGHEVWRWSHGKAFIQVLGQETFQPGVTVTYTEVWDQSSNAGEQVTPGDYDVLGIDVGCEELGERCHFGMGLPIEITP